MKQLVIVGAGASGIAAAISAARTAQARKADLSILLLEHKDTVGKKILATGNGRCNLTNTRMDLSCYHSDDLSVAGEILTAYGTQEILYFFASMGLCTCERYGYVYPRSAQASSVLRTLTDELSLRGVTVRTGVHVAAIRSCRQGFQLQTEDEILPADAVILSTGGKAASHFGSDGSGYGLAVSMGHTLSNVVPALVQLRVKDNPFGKITGVRTIAQVTALIEGREAASDTGELQLTDYGLSGIPIFQISRSIAKALDAGQTAQVKIDFLPEMEAADLTAYLQAQRTERGGVSAADFLLGLFNERLCPRLLRLAHLSPKQKAESISDEDIRHLVRIIKGVRVTISDTHGFDHAQVCAGGVRLEEVKADTLESRKRDGLYLTGELLDVDGLCGGYNLHWAWATGLRAGEAAANRLS